MAGAGSNVKSVSELSHADRLKRDSYLDGLVVVWRAAVRDSDAKRRANGDHMAGKWRIGQQRDARRKHRGEA